MLDVVFLFSQLCVLDQVNWYSYCGNSEYCMSSVSVSLSLCVASSRFCHLHTLYFFFVIFKCTAFLHTLSSTAWLPLTRLRPLIDQNTSWPRIIRITVSLVSCLHFVSFHISNSCKIGDVLYRKSYCKYIICMKFRKFLYLLRQVKITTQGKEMFAQVFIFLAILYGCVSWSHVKVRTQAQGVR